MKKKINHLAFIIAALCLPILVFSQYSETINTDRPGQAISPHTIGAKMLQVQMGVNYNKNKTILDGLSEIKSRAFTHSTILRYGIFERVELNAVLDWQNTGLLPSSGETNTAFSNNQLGIRMNILEQANGPGIGVQWQLLLDPIGKPNNSENIGSSIAFIMSQSIAESLGATLILGLTWDGYEPSATPSYILNVSYSITDQIGVFAEAYGIYGNKAYSEKFDINYDGGVWYLINPNLQLDFSAGWQGDKQLENVEVGDWFADLGFSWRFDLDKTRGTTPARNID